MAQPKLPRRDHAVRALSACIVLAFCSMVPTLAVGADKTPKVVVNQWDQKVVRRSVVVTPDEFSPARAEQISREFLKEKRGEFTVLKLSIFVDEGDEKRSDSGKGATGMNYPWWRQ